MEKFGAIGSKVTAFGAIDKLRFVIDALDLLREQAEAYAKRLEDVDTGIREDIRNRLNAINRTYLPELREARSKIADVQLATHDYVIAVERLVRSILATPTYRQRLKEEVRKVRESEVQDNPRSLLASYRRILADHLSDAGKALEKYDAAQKEAQKILDNISGIIQPLKQDVEEEKRRSKDKESLLIAGTVATSVACGGAGVGLAAAGLAITCPRLLLLRSWRYWESQQRTSPYRQWWQQQELLPRLSCPVSSGNDCTVVSSKPGFMARRWTMCRRWNL